MQPGTYKIQG